MVDARGKATTVSAKMYLFVTWFLKYWFKCLPLQKQAMFSSVVAKLKGSEKHAIFQVSYEDYEKFKKNLGTSCSYLNHCSSSRCQSKKRKKKKKPSPWSPWYFWVKHSAYILMTSTDALIHLYRETGGSCQLACIPAADKQTEPSGYNRKQRLPPPIRSPKETEPPRFSANKYLAEVKHGTEKLQFNIEPPRLVVEQPPQTAGEILWREEKGTSKLSTRIISLHPAHTTITSLADN